MAPLSRQARRLFSVLISLTCLSLTPAQTPPHESLWLPHWAPRFSYPSPLPPREFSQEVGCVYHVWLRSQSLG